jgi:hypothetical protein
MTRGRYSHRIVAGVALTLLLGVGTGLTACSDDSSDDSETTTASSSTAGSSSAAPSSSGTPDSPAPEDAPEGGAPAPQGDDADADQGSTPVDPATAILGAGDAPAGFTVTDPQQAQQTDIAGTQQMLDAMTVTPPECKAVLQEQLAAGDAAAAGVSTVTYSDGGEQFILGAVGPAGSNQTDNGCSNLTAKGDMNGVPVSITSTSEDVAVNLNGVENARGVRSNVAMDVGGQQITIVQTTISGTVNGNDFSVTGSEGVSQDVLVGLARTQADRLRG